MQRRLGSTSLKDLIIITLSTLGLTFLIWLPHLLSLHSFYNLDFSAGFNTIYRNFDGIEYVVIAKSLYNPAIIAQLPQSMPASYYASHFPGYALAILLFAPLIGYLKSMLLASVLFTVLSALMFYTLTKEFRLTNHPLYLSLLFLILPARWLIVHSVGSAEPMFIFFTIAAIYFFMKYEVQPQAKWIWGASLMALGAQITRPPGILLFFALAIYIHWKLWLHRKTMKLKDLMIMHLRYYPLALIPLSLLAIFFWYGQSYHDYFAYFHSGDNIHLTFPPFQVFDKHQFWVGEIWLEDIIYIFGLGFLGGFMLWKQNKYVMSCFVLTYLAASTMVVHRDIARYTLPVFPFLLIAFEKVLTSKEFKLVVLILLVGIYLYSQNFIIENVAPIANLSYFSR